MAPFFNRSSHLDSFRGKVFRDGKFIQSEFFVIDGKIKYGLNTKPVEASFIIPPFADPHLHGGWGYSFRRGEFEALEKKLRALGVLFAVPALENESAAEARHVGSLFRRYKKNNPDSIFPFLRMEGPFISKIKKGFQSEDHILEATSENIEDFFSIDEIKMFTYAPEIKGVETLIRNSIKSGKILSMGHSHASFKEFDRSYKMGIRHLTHFPNAMSGLFHREIGLTGAGLLLDDLYLEVISDGVHNSFDFISLILKTKGPNFSICSDLVPPAFSGVKKIEGRDVLIKGKKITLKDGTIAGGGTPVSEQVMLLFDRGIKPEELVSIACLNSLRSFGYPLPSLAEGEDATFLVLDNKMSVRAVYVKGESIRG